MECNSLVQEGHFCNTRLPDWDSDWSSTTSGSDEHCCCWPPNSHRETSQLFWTRWVIMIFWKPLMIHNLDPNNTKWSTTWILKHYFANSQYKHEVLPILLYFSGPYQNSLGNSYLTSIVEDEVNANLNNWIDIATYDQDCSAGVQSLECYKWYEPVRPVNYSERTYGTYEPLSFLLIPGLPSQHRSGKSGQN